MKYVLLVLFTCSILGCAEYETSQLQLIDSARKGVALVAQSHDQQLQRIDQLQQMQRKRLDDAFDADVRINDELSGDWVIAHRKAYVVGIDALNAQATAARSSADADTQNLKAVDAALTALRRIKAAELKLIQVEK